MFHERPLTTSPNIDLQIKTFKQSQGLAKSNLLAFTAKFYDAYSAVRSPSRKHYRPLGALVMERS